MAHTRKRVPPHLLRTRTRQNHENPLVPPFATNFKSCFCGLALRYSEPWQHCIVRTGHGSSWSIAGCTIECFYFKTWRGGGGGKRLVRPNCQSVIQAIIKWSFCIQTLFSATDFKPSGFTDLCNWLLNVCLWLAVFRKQKASKRFKVRGSLIKHIMERQIQRKFALQGSSRLHMYVHSTAIWAILTLVVNDSL